MAEICCSCEKVRQIVREVLAEMLAEMPRTRKKRAPSAYNLYMKECIPTKTGPIQERFRQCAREYKQRIK